MSRLTDIVLAVVIATSAAVACAQPYTNVGRSATSAEIAAWDIDVRADFKGLPRGSGTVALGQKVWDGKCASCHGSFGESNEVFMPLVGGTTKEDMKSGRVAALGNNSQPQRTTLMKVATLSTLWDYINRAMPWTAPKSLSTEEVYAVTAYILNLGGIVADDFTLSDKNIAEVQKIMPNRDGMTQAHGMWKTNGKPDVRNVACMKNCATEVKVHSELPEFARGAHGNMAQQNRPFGAVRGVDTAQAAAGTASAASEKPAVSEKPAAIARPAGDDGLRLVKQYACVACHGMTNKIVGPGFSEIAARYNGNAGAEAPLMARVKNGGSGAWGAIPMPPHAGIQDAEIKSMVQWILAGARAQAK